MKKCQFAIQEPYECGKDICCYYCDKRNDCFESCEEMVDKESGEYICCHQVEVNDELSVMEETCSYTISTLTAITLQIDKLKKQEEQFRKRLLEAMEVNGIKKFENEQVSFTYVAPTTRSSIDSSKLKKLYPDIAEECTKVSNVSASVRISVK